MSEGSAVSVARVPAAGLRAYARWGLHLTCAGIILAALALCLTTEGFLSVANTKAILSSAAFVGILAVGMTAIMVSGSLVSLSLGVTAAVCAMFFIFSLRLGLPVAILSTLALGVATGIVQGLAVGGLGANPIILTFAAGALQEGVAVSRTGGATISPPDSAYQVLNSTPLGIPLSVFVLVAFALLVELGLRRTWVGREAVLVGENPAAARAAGLSLTRAGTAAFATAGLAAGVVGVLLGAYNQSASLLLTGTLTFDAIAATLVAGTVVAGGHGSAVKTLVGAIAIAALSNALLLRDLDTGWQIVIKGLIVTFVVVALHVRARSRAG